MEQAPHDAGMEGAAAGSAPAASAAPAAPAGSEQGPVVSAQAPVLLIPHLLTSEFCRELIDVWEQQGNIDSGFMVQEGDRTVGKYDYSRKIRQDHFLQPGDMLERVKATIGPRVVPEVFKACNFRITRFEDFRIACYDSRRGGFFRPHRDNTTPGTAHRRFAMSLNLNTEDYDGGMLRFPEYGPMRYQPGTGSAVVFSCSLLHEATDITRGRRFVLLSFFYGNAEAKAREAYAKQAGDAYRAGGSEG